MEIGNADKQRVYEASRYKKWEVLVQKKGDRTDKKWEIDVQKMVETQSWYKKWEICSQSEK